MATTNSSATAKRSSGGCTSGSPLWRLSVRREFFRVPIKIAIKALQEEAQRFALATGVGSRFELLGQLRQRFGDWLKADFVGAAFVQIDDLCLLETTRAPVTHLKDLIIEQTDLGFISDYPDDEGDERYFKGRDTPQVNAKKFIELDDTTFFHTLPLFTDEAYRESDHRDTLKHPRGTVQPA